MGHGRDRHEGTKARRHEGGCASGHRCSCFHRRGRQTSQHQDLQTSIPSSAGCRTRLKKATRDASVATSRGPGRVRSATGCCKESLMATREALEATRHPPARRRAPPAPRRVQTDRDRAALKATSAALEATEPFEGLEVLRFGGWEVCRGAWAATHDPARSAARASCWVPWPRWRGHAPGGEPPHAEACSRQAQAGHPVLNLRRRRTAGEATSASPGSPGTVTLRHQAASPRCRSRRVTLESAPSGGRIRLHH